MPRGLLWVWCAVVLVVGCRKEPESQAAGRTPEATTSEEVVAGTPEMGEAAVEEEEERPYVLTEAKLEAYVGYQRKMLGVHATMAKDLQALRRRTDGGDLEGLLRGKKGAKESLQLLEAKAEAEAQAREEAGLTEEDVNRIGALVTDIIGQRQLVVSLKLGSELEKLEAMRSKLGLEQQKELSLQVEALREQVKALEGLDRLRRAHGDANVDRVLTREQELTKNYQDMLEAFGARSQ